MNGVQRLKKTKGIVLAVVLFLVFISLSACNFNSAKQLQNVGVLMDDYLQDNEWNSGAYEGLQRIQEKFDVDIYLKENIQSKNDIINAVDELEVQGVNLIFGHSRNYGKIFVDVAAMYPHIHFVYYNGGYFLENVTSLNISSHAMGFFSGMVAGKMTETDHVGIIAAYDWQPEIEGFYEGVKFENPAAIVHFNYIDGRDKEEVGLSIYEEMKEEHIDVIYPTSYSISESVVEQAIKDDIYSIGYFVKEKDYDPETVLTSTIQHVDLLYMETAKKFNDGLLEGDIYFYDFAEDVISFGSFSSLVPRSFKRELRKYISKYKKTNLLPNELMEK